MWIIKIIKIEYFYPPRILEKHRCIYFCLQQTPPRENWFQYVRREYTTAINLPCLITFIYMYKILPNLTKVMNLATRIIKAIELEKQTNKSHHVYNTHWLLQIANIYLLSKVHTRLHRKLNDSIFWSSNFFCINVIMKHNIVSPCNFKILNFRISRHLAAKKFSSKDYDI